MNIDIDPERCTGHGRCYMLSPEIFDADDEGRGYVVSDEPIGPELVAAANRAILGCPEGAITLLESFR